MLYVIIGHDAPDATDKRPAVRPAHLEHLAPLARAGRIKLAGKLLDRTADILYPYRQDSDFAYVTGFPEADAVCLLAPDAPERYVLLVRPHDPERAIWVGARVGVEGAVQQYGADAAFSLEELDQVLPRFLEKAPHVYHNVARADPLAVRLLAAIRRAQAGRPRSGTGPTAIRDPAEILHELRPRTEPGALARLRQALAIACQAHREAMRTG